MAEKTKLRCGFTTGTCAAAAVKAAAQMLLSGTSLSDISLVLPNGSSKVFPVEQIAVGSDTVSCAIRKDAGDDPDVTDGILIYASVSRIPADLAAAYAVNQPCYRFEDNPFLFLTGGVGIGMVTKQGLSCEPGGYAINPVPRRMIFEEAAAVCIQFGISPEETLWIEISAPEGKKLAEKTFNKNLGIVGGLSILGTSGIVNPMSEEALVETIRLDIRVKAQEGRTVLAVAPGNYGEAFLKDKLGISMNSFVKCSNFIGDAFRMMREEQVTEVLLAGHLGKLIKVAGGVLNTHSKYGDRRMEILCTCAEEAGVSPLLAESILHMNTSEEASEYLRQIGYLDQVMNVVVNRIQRVLEDYSGISVEVVVFSNVQGLLGMTDGAVERLKKIT
ncbi:MAG: cobalt-precorrin-5B (C(1))-methyltransferase CbiD [Clostridium sp.]